MGGNDFLINYVLLKRHLQQWNKVFGNVFSNVRSTEENMKLKKALYDSNRNKVAKIQLKQARAIYMQRLLEECEFWRQKFAVRWIQAGDINTSYFHSLCKQSRNSNFIGCIKGESGNWLHDTGEIKSLVVEFFSSLLQSERKGRRKPQLEF